MTYMEYKIARLNQLLREPRCRDAFSDDRNRIAGLVDLLVTTNPATVLEIGSHRGVSTEVFLLFCTVLALDPFEETAELSLSEFNHRCGGYPNLRTLKGRSPEALAGLPDAAFDLVYIDGDHDLDAVRRDIAGSYRLVKPGGYLAGHDHHEDTEVPKAVAEYIAERGGELKVFGDSSWAVQKVQA